NELPQLLDKLKMEIQTDIIVLFSVYEDKISIVVGVSEDYLKKISAIDIIKVLTKVLGGRGGGGRPDFARAGGGNNKSKIPKACDAVKELIKSL
ncbi:MAG: DHHA1 domain-containing protein, partial [Pirellulales bacterium]|nr:DHHA1 domain-containing protein [Pirellulales bacterium]